jgi:hypothetical protein
MKYTTEKYQEKQERENRVQKYAVVKTRKMVLVRDSSFG